MALEANALTTWATLKGELGLTDDTQQAFGERIINSASGAIERFCSRSFGYSATITEKLVPPPGQRLVLPRAPIVAIASVTLYGTALTADTDSGYLIESASAGILFRRYGWSPWDIIREGVADQPVPGTARPDALVVVYGGGWVLPSQQGTRTLPYDVEEACLVTAVSLYRKRGRDRDVASEALGGWSATYRGTAAGLPDDAAAILEPYRRRA